MASLSRHLRARVLKAVFQAHTQMYEVSDGLIGAWIGPGFILSEVNGGRNDSGRLIRPSLD